MSVFGIQGETRVRGIRPVTRLLGFPPTRSNPCFSSSLHWPPVQVTPVCPSLGKTRVTLPLSRCLVRHCVFVCVCVCVSMCVLDVFSDGGARSS